MSANHYILEQLFYKASRISQIDTARFTIGERYAAALSPSGQIGVCATLNAHPDANSIKSIDFSTPECRVIANAFVNAMLNYTAKIDGTGDIFNAIDFREYSRVVMIGYFGSLVQKLQGVGVNPSVFDVDQHEAPVLPMEQQRDYLNQADCVILTSTSLSNNTFGGIVDAVQPTTDIFMLGPSTPLDDLMFSVPQVKGLFGSLFPHYHHETLSLIAQGHGTRGFMHNMQKVYRLKDCR